MSEAVKPGGREWEDWEKSGTIWVDRLSSGRETKLGHRVQTHCHAAVPTNDRNADRRGQRDISELLSKKGGSTDDIQSGDAEKPGSVIRLVSK